MKFQMRMVRRSNMAGNLNIAMTERFYYNMEVDYWSEV